MGKHHLLRVKWRVPPGPLSQRLPLTASRHRAPLVLERHERALAVTPADPRVSRWLMLVGWPLGVGQGPGPSPASPHILLVKDQKSRKPARGSGCDLGALFLAVSLAGAEKWSLSPELAEYSPGRSPLLVVPGVSSLPRPPRKCKWCCGWVGVPPAPRGPSGQRGLWGVSSAEGPGRACGGPRRVLS